MHQIRPTQLYKSCKNDNYIFHCLNPVRFFYYICKCHFHKFGDNNNSSLKSFYLIYLDFGLHLLSIHWGKGHLLRTDINIYIVMSKKFQLELKETSSIPRPWRDYLYLVLLPGKIWEKCWKNLGQDRTTPFNSGKVLNGLEINLNPRFFLKFSTEQEMSGSVVEFWN